MDVSEGVDSRWARRSRARIGVCEWCRELSETVASCLGCADELCLRCWGEGNDRLCGVCRHRSVPVFDEVVVTSGMV